MLVVLYGNFELFFKYQQTLVFKSCIEKDTQMKDFKLNIFKTQQQKNAPSRTPSEDAPNTAAEVVLRFRHNE